MLDGKKPLKSRMKIIMKIAFFSNGIQMNLIFMLCMPKIFVFVFWFSHRKNLLKKMLRPDFFCNKWMGTKILRFSNSSDHKKCSFQSWQFVTITQKPIFQSIPIFKKTTNTRKPSIRWIEDFFFLTKKVMLDLSFLRKKNRAHCTLGPIGWKKFRFELLIEDFDLLQF